MFSTESRPLADAEREHLRARIRRVGRRLIWEPLWWFVLTVGLFVFGIPAMATERSQSLPVRLLVIAAFIFFYVMVARGLPETWREARAERQKLRDALDESLVEVARYEAYGAIALVDPGQEQAVADAIYRDYPKATNIWPEVYSTQASDGARVVKL